MREVGSTAPLSAARCRRLANTFSKVYVLSRYSALESTLQRALESVRKVERAHFSTLQTALESFTEHTAESFKESFGEL